MVTRFGVVEIEPERWVAGELYVEGIEDDCAEGVTPQDAINLYWEKHAPPLPDEDTVSLLSSQVAQLSEAVEELYHKLETLLDEK